MTLSTSATLDKNSLLFDRKLETVTEGLTGEYFNLLNKIPKEDAMTVLDYLISLKTEINPSDNYRKSVIKLVTKFIVFCRHADVKPIKQMGREDILAFLESFRKSENLDPSHKWIGTYNLYRIHLLRFFKWLHSPDTEPDKRSKPSVIENIQKLNRKERSIYKPTDLWAFEDDKLFLKYCPSKRICERINSTAGNHRIETLRGGHYKVLCRVPKAEEITQFRLTLRATAGTRKN